MACTGREPRDQAHELARGREGSVYPRKVLIRELPDSVADCLTVVGDMPSVREVGAHPVLAGSATDLVPIPFELVALLQIHGGYAVVAGSAVKDVPSRAAAYPVVAATPIRLVVARVPVQLVGEAEASQQVVSTLAIEYVDAVVAYEPVGAVGSLLNVAADVAPSRPAAKKADAVATMANIRAIFPISGTTSA